MTAPLTAIPHARPSLIDLAAERDKAREKARRRAMIEIRLSVTLRDLGPAGRRIERLVHELRSLDHHG